MRSTGLFALLLAGAVALPIQDPDAKATMTKIITEKGYPVEKHYATTKDGYILTMFRIPYGFLGKTAGKRPVVLLQHCLLCSSFDWVANSQDESLAFILADAGYDVWLGNNRGNIFSKNHTTLSHMDPKFWDFSFDEYATLDLPAEVDLALSTTGEQSLSYVGHSQGTLIGFAGFSADKMLASKINLFVALAPIGYLYNNIYMEEGRIPGLIAMAEHLPNMGIMAGGLLNKGASPFCSLMPSFCNFCLQFAGGMTNHMNATREQVYLSRTPAGTSLKNVIHFLQGGRTNKIQKYDYGTPMRNLARYGTKSPPEYNMADLSVKTALFQGGHDILADKADVAKLVSVLPAASLVHHEEVHDYAHLDFIWAPDAKTIVYPGVLKLLKQHAPVRSGVSVMV